jgi:opacity protein-like surface antigen
MNMHNYLPWILSTLLSTVIAVGQVPAQLWQPPAHREWEISVFGGVSSAGSRNSVTPVEGADSGRIVGLEYKSGYLLGVRITQNLGQKLGAELDYNFANQPGAFLDLIPGTSRLDLHHNIHSLVYSMLYYPLDRSSRFRPFGTLGGGASLFNLSDDSKTEAATNGIPLSDSWKFAFSFGGGFKYLLLGQLGLRFDIRDQITGVPAYGLPNTAPVVSGEDPGAAFRADGKIHNWLANVGLSYTWGD